MKQRYVAVCILSAMATVASAADPQLLKLVMPDAKVVSGIDVDHVKTTPFGQFFLSQFLADTGFKDLVNATGFDPRRDVREIVMASPGDPARKAALLVVRGNFDTARLLPLVQASGAKIENYHGIPLLAGKDKTAQATALIDNSTLVAGDIESVRGAIDRRNGSIAISAELSGKISQTSANQDAWLVSTAPVSSFAAVAPERNVRGALQGDVFKSIEQSSGAIRFGNVIEISGELIARTNADATSLADVLKFLSSMLQMNAPAGQAAQFAALLQNLTVTAQANAVKFSILIPEVDFETALRLATSRVGARTPKI